MKKYNFIELLAYLENLEGAEVWAARAHYDGQTIDGFALATEEICDFYDDDPRKLSEDELLGGLRLPAYHLAGRDDLTWNRIAAAADCLDGAYDGIERIGEDFPVELIALEELPGFFEVASPGGDTIATLPDGRATALSDWIFPFPEEAQDREGIAVPAEILIYL